MKQLTRSLLLLFCLTGAAALQARCELKPEPRALVAPAKGELLLVTQNLWRLVDDRPDTSADQPVDTLYMQQRLDAVARYMGDVLQWPHLLAVQEVEHVALLEDLLRRVREQGGPGYRIAMVEGLDPSGIDVALLYRSPVKVSDISSPFHGLRYKRSPLYSRPPLVVSLSKPIKATLVIVHLRSGRDLEDERKGKNIQEKRRRQAQTLRTWMLAQTGEVIVAGDFNSSFGDEIYQQPIELLEQPPFISVWQQLPEQERFSYIYQCRPQAIDNILLGPATLQRVLRAQVSRGNAGYQYRLYKRQPPYLVSDHDALGVYFDTK